MNYSFFKIPFILGVIFLFSLEAAIPKSKDRYIIATANAGGTYYPVGVGIATIASIKLAKNNKLFFSAITSAGSSENIKLLEAGEVDFAIMQGLIGSMAWQGKEKYLNTPKKNLRSISMLWQNIEQFTINSNYVQTGNINDLKNLYGEKFSIGGINSGSRVSAETILKSLGIDSNNMDIQYLGYSSSAIALKKQEIKGMNTPGGVPTSVVTNTFKELGDKKVKLLEFTMEDLNKINKSYPVWSIFTITKGTYPEQKKDIQTIAQPNLLVVTKDTPDEVVYLLTKTIYENLPFLHEVHNATKAISLKKAIVGLPMPLHSGARKYYEEKGIKIPTRLLEK